MKDIHMWEYFRIHYTKNSLYGNSTGPEEDNQSNSDKDQDDSGSNNENDESNPDNDQDEESNLVNNPLNPVNNPALKKRIIKT